MPKAPDPNRTSAPTPQGRSATRQGTETRQRLIRAALTLFQSQGYHATGIAQILAHSGVPKGSLYHHFPAGKESLAIATIDWIDAEMQGRFTRAAQGAVPADKQIKRLFSDTAAWIEAHDFSQGALLATLAQEVEPGQTALRSRISLAYREATERLGQALAAGGAAKPNDLAITVLAALDGAVPRARAQRSTATLIQIGTLLAQSTDIATD